MSLLQNSALNEILFAANAANNTTSNSQADTSMVDYVSELMRNKLAKKRNEGRGGWYRLHVVKNEKLLEMLKNHVDKGDMVDVLNIAAMIYTRTELYGDKA